MVKPPASRKTITVRPDTVWPWVKPGQRGKYYHNIFTGEVISYQKHTALRAKAGKKLPTLWQELGRLKRKQRGCRRVAVGLRAIDADGRAVGGQFYGWSARVSAVDDYRKSLDRYRVAGLIGPVVGVQLMADCHD